MQLYFLQRYNSNQIKNKIASQVMLTYSGEVTDRLGSVLRCEFLKEIQEHFNEKERLEAVGKCILLFVFFTFVTT
jgi:hypothetical protein